MTSSFEPDREVAAAMSFGGNTETPVAADPRTWKSARTQLDIFYSLVTSELPKHPEVVRVHQFTTVTPEGAELTLHWFTSDSVTGAAVVQAHGGGRIAGRVEMFTPYLSDYVANSDVSILAVEYRLAPEVTGATPTEDVYAGLVWLVENAAQLGVDRSRIGLLGESAGGGLSAGVALLARQNDIKIAGQMLIYPMLDDRTRLADEYLAPYTEWIVEANRLGWDTLLGAARGTDEVSAIVAPGRNTDFSDLPRSYIEVGELDLFRDEAVKYAIGLWSAGVSTELHVLPGAQHGFDHWAPTAGITNRAMQGRIAFLRSL